MVLAGADVFRLNFAHGDHVKMAEFVAKIRQIAKELDRPIGILADLAGPKTRLGNLPDGKLSIEQRGRYVFVRQVDSDDPTALTTTYNGLIDYVQVDDRIMLADGTVSLRVIEKLPDRAVCDVEHPGEQPS